MVLTVLCLAVDTYNWIKHRQRIMRLLKIIHRHLEHTSIILRRVGRGSHAGSDQRVSRLVRHNSAGWLENVLFEEKGKHMLSVSPKVCLELDGWISYLASQDNPILPTYPISHHAYVLFETSQAVDTQDYLQQSFSVPITHRVKVVDCCEPLAWRSGVPFGIVARCSVQNLARLVDSHLQGHLWLDDMLELHQMMTVDVEGSAGRLLELPVGQSAQTSGSTTDSQNSIRSLWENAVESYREPETAVTQGPTLLEQLPPEAIEKTQTDTFDITDGGFTPSNFHADKPMNATVQGLLQSLAQTVSHNLDEFDCGLDDEDATDLYEGSNESLASSVADLRDVRGEIDQFAQTVEEVMTLNGDVISDMMDSMAIEAAGEGMGGESLSGPLEELAPEMLTPCKRRLAMRTKPPNVLIYCGKKDSTRQFEAVKAVLMECINLSGYVIYQLKHDQVLTAPWSENTALLVLASEKAYDGTDAKFMEHFTQGGIVLSLGCAFDDAFVERVQTGTSMGVMSLTAFKQWRDVNLICGCHVYKNTDSQISDVTLRPLASHDGYPVIIEANHDLSNGVAILSQVLLDKDPMQLAVNPEVFTMLKKSNSARFGILRHVIGLLGVDTERPKTMPYTFSVLLAKDEAQKEAFLRSIEPRLNNGRMNSRKLNLQFIESLKETHTPVTADNLAVVTNAGSADGKYNFNINEYRKHLETERLGQFVIYSDIMSTTMNVIEVLMFPVPKDLGLVTITGQQTMGVGRGGNAWLSPPGCAMFSLLVRVALNTQLGNRISFLQHIAALAVVQGITTIRGYEKLDLRLKWPNDIYYGSVMKLGGVVIKSSIMQTTIHANIGIGFNVDNKDPTICLNDLVHQYNLQHGTTLPKLTSELVIARAINWLEILIKSFEQNGPEKFLSLYYKRWLHGDSRVQLQSSIGPSSEVSIIGLDDFGYLQVMTAAGEKQSLHPDGNSFDMMKGLIVPKSS